MAEFIVGVDLGQVGDYSAISIVQRVAQWKREIKQWAGVSQWTDVEKPPMLHCRQLARLDRGTKYPEVVRKIKLLMARPDLSGATLIVDGTGVGRGVVDMFTEAGMKPKAVTVTSGTSANRDGGYYKVPKRDLVASAQTALQDGRLKMADGLVMADALVKEMTNFKVKITEAAHDSYGAWREGENDDLIFAVMLATWWAQYRKTPRAATSHDGFTGLPNGFGWVKGR